MPLAEESRACQVRLTSRRSRHVSLQDVEGSTKLLERHPADYGHLIARPHELLEHAVEVRGGVVFETIGDTVYAAFADLLRSYAAADA